MPSFLITGIAGHIGYEVGRILALADRNNKVYGVDNMASGAFWKIKEKEYPFDFVITSRLEFDFPCDYVIHCAAFPYEGLSPFLRAHVYKENVLLTAKVVNYCIRHNVRRLVFLSSMAVYGDIKAPFDESDVPSPIDPYGISKLCCELDIRSASITHGLDYCIIRPHNVYGPGQNIWSKYRNVIGRWVLQCLKGEKLTVYGDGLQKRAFSYIDDVAPCIVNACFLPEASKETINLGGKTPITILEAAETVNRICNGVGVEFLQPRVEVKDAWCSYEKSERVLGYKEITSFDEGVYKTYQWAKSVYGKKVIYENMPKLEIFNGLYDYWK
ncbi:MAG: putative UDP-glucose epimerase YtcB [Patescibacteria group bacterium]|nr:MAG: putative UDP-glucose epimerase YtcB [Patescibacteria group bacterium]